MSIPVIWNSSEAVFYVLGNKNHVSGKAVSGGINLTYSQDINETFFVRAGFGYYDQKFNMKRPFDFDNPVQYGWATKSYSYKNLNFNLGFGVSTKIAQKIILSSSVNYIYLISFSQKYIVNDELRQVNKMTFSPGSMLNGEFCMERKISNRISFEAGVVFPVFAFWGHDEIFYGSQRDAQKVARNKLSIGGIASFCYHL